MPSVHQPIVVRVTSEAPQAIEVDAWIVPVFEGDDLDGLTALNEASGGQLTAARARGEFTGRACEVLTVPLSGWKAGWLVAVGGGPRTEFAATAARRATTTGALAVRARRLTRLGVLSRTLVAGSAEHVVQAIAEGAFLANYDGASLKTDPRRQPWLDELVIVAEASADVRTAAARGALLGEATNQARALVNEPGNLLTPRVFAERAVEMARAAGLPIDVLDEREIAELGMGLLRGVARGSTEPPRVLVMRHDPPGVTVGPVLGLVGKGVTFDSGGISIKSADNMDKMKGDMAGGAAVVAAMCAIARLGVPLRVVGIVPATENLPDGDAMKPGDVLTSAAGKTVEVLNTDAEGRLILGDAVWYARQLGATHLVDVATLTGACMIALGKTTTGLFATPPAWSEQVRLASERAGERMWPMPLFEDYRELFRSEIADFSNTGGRYGGAITAALFIKEFAGDLPWAHLDIAGPAWADEAKPYQPKGATGAAVRTLVELALAAGEWARH